MTTTKIDKSVLWASACSLAFSTGRGTSDPEDPYGCFNACHYTGDSSDHIGLCRQLLADSLGISPRLLIIPHQTHSCNVATIRSADHIPSLDNVDALVADIPGIALCINTADCLPLALVDEEAGVIAVAHSGWRGTVGEIATAVVDQMKTLGAMPQRIKAAMGPTICNCCFEVGEEVAAQFRSRWPDAVIDNRWSKPHVDLPRAVFTTLIRQGLASQNISLPDHCSMCDSNRFFSARRLGVNSGRTLTVAMLRDHAAEMHL